MNIIVPACGLSTRFPNRPLKWLLTDPSGKLMIQKALSGIVGEYNKIYFIVNNIISVDYSIQTIRRIMSCYKNVELVVLEYQTGSQAETVYKALTSISMQDVSGPIYIKDTDNFFKTNLLDDNNISTYSLNNADTSHKGKSYVTLDGTVVENIVEKKVISDIFCCGGYGFKNAADYIKYYKEGMGYISDVIRAMIGDGHVFFDNPATDYIDWGDLESWEKYRRKFRTLFVDVDGVVFINSGEYSTPSWGHSSGIKRNIDYLNKLYDDRTTQIILVTARPEWYRRITEDQLQREGVKYHMLIMGMLHAKRIIVNDYSTTNPYRSCDAINVKRNGNIEDQLVGGL